MRPGSPWFGIRTLASTLFFVSVCATLTPVHAQTGKPENAAKPDLPAGAATGKYVATAADCGSCHSAPGGKPFAGGAALKSAFGSLYAPNITQDVATGIGSWSKEDFERALRRGIRKDGSYLYPAMPYDSYTKMSAADMDALWAYMKTVPAVSNKVPANTLPFPLTIRSGLAVWQSLYFKPGPFEPVQSKSAAWNRGAYLVEALGHCGDCHTPRNVAQGLETQHSLGGAKIEGWYAPDIGNDPLSKVAHWQTDALAHYLKTGVAPGNVKTFGPMQEVVHDSLAQLTESDLRAIAIYLKDQGGATQTVTVSKVKLLPDSLATGKRLYEDNCSSCHHSNGRGIPGVAPALAGNGAVTAGEPYNVIMALLEGFPPQGSWGAMGSFAHTFSDEQIADVTNYVRTAWGNGALPNATPWSIADWRKNAEASPNEADALLCPNLPQDVMRAALSIQPAALEQAANNQAKLRKVVADYRAARPQSSTAQTIEALSTAYCRSLANEHMSKSRMSIQIADFAQQVAVAAMAPAPTARATSSAH